MRRKWDKGLPGEEEDNVKKKEKKKKSRCIVGLKDYMSEMSDSWKLIVVCWSVWFFDVQLNDWMMVTHCWWPVAIWCRGGRPESVSVCVRVTWWDCRSVRQQTEASFSNPHWATAYNELTQRGEQKKKKTHDSLSVYSQVQQAYPASPWANITRLYSLLILFTNTLERT